MKVILFASPEFTTTFLQRLLYSKEIEVVAVVTQPDKPVGRKQTITAPAIKVFAQEEGIPVLQPKNKKELAKQLEEYEADFFVVIAYGMIFTPKILEMPKYGCINVHFSLLPKYRGASPMQASLLNGDQETGISILKMDEELDHGPIYILRKVRIEKEDNFEMLTKKLSEIGSVLLPATLFDIASQDLSPITQSHQQASFCQKINKGDGEIDFNSKNAEEIHNMIRAYTPWPSSYCEYKGKKLKILEAEFEDNISLKPGEFKVEGKTLSIGTKKGVLIPKKLQPEGKKPMDVGSFINGLS